MAVQMLQSSQFTLTFRGYDKAEVDDYVESLWDRQAETTSALEEAEEAIVSLEAKVQAHVQRVADLESCVRDENPRTIAALGERVTLILEQAEDAAAETVVAAQQEADAIRQNAAQAAQRVTQHAASHASELETSAAVIVRTASERARQLENDARRSATQILDEAEAQAQARISDITDWVNRVRAQIKAEQIQAAEEFFAARNQRQAELHDIVARRDGVLDGLRTVCESVTETISEQRGLEHPVAVEGDVPTNGSFNRADADPSSRDQHTGGVTTATGTISSPVTVDTTASPTPATTDPDTLAEGTHPDDTDSAG